MDKLARANVRVALSRDQNTLASGRFQVVFVVHKSSKDSLFLLDQVYHGQSRDETRLLFHDTDPFDLGNINAANFYETGYKRILRTRSARPKGETFTESHLSRHIKHSVTLGLYPNSSYSQSFAD